jgi:xanthine dehydrogenase YagT iron-sulfur-binding subunit
MAVHIPSPIEGITEPAPEGSSLLNHPITAASLEQVKTSLTVNGVALEVKLEPWVTLLDALRERLAITGPKKGCNQGACGACTVLIDGRRVLSCLTLALTCRDREVVTVEGLVSADGTPHPLQTAFAEQDALQCGYCTPGQIMSAVGMLAEAETGMPSAAGDVRKPFEGLEALTEQEIRERLSGNICRCAAYQNIVAAVQRVAAGG